VALKRKGTGIMTKLIDEADRIDDWLYLPDLPETLYGL
jgi:hypothetical protein